MSLYKPFDSVPLFVGEYQGACYLYGDPLRLGFPKKPKTWSLNVGWQHLEHYGHAHVM